MAPSGRHAAAGAAGRTVGSYVLSVGDPDDGFMTRNARYFMARLFELRHVLQHLRAKNSIEGVVRKLEVRNVALRLHDARYVKLRHAEIERGYLGEVFTEER